MKEYAVCDIETDGIDNPKHIWTVVFRALNKAQDIYICHTAEEAFEALNYFDYIIGHNFIGFDAPVLEDLWGIHIPKDQIIDTLILSRLLNYNIQGGHALDAWGKRLGFPKSKFDDFSQWSQELEDRCVSDTLITLKLYKFLMECLDPKDFKEAIELEHFIADVCVQLHKDGFAFDIHKATRLHYHISYRLKSLKSKLQEVFPPSWEEIKTCTPRLTAKGTLHKGDFRWLPNPKDITFFSPGKEFTLYHSIPFNPRSHKQVIDRLDGYWDPTVKTDGHIKFEREMYKFPEGWEEKRDHYKRYGWKISEENLGSLRENAPLGAKKLAIYLKLDSRRSTLEEWMQAYSPQTERLHGKFNGTGAWTQRMSHYAPNQGNIPALDSTFGTIMRSCFKAKEGYTLVGVDAKGIQLRVLAHYINDEEFTQALIHGTQEEENDAHSLNALALGFNPKELYDVRGRAQTGRDIAKTFIYAWLLGAGNTKQAEILGLSLTDAKRRNDSFIQRYPGLQRLKTEDIPRDGQRGYFVGFDGRKVVHPGSAHYVLAGYLQNGEAIVMKLATRWWMQCLRNLRIPFTLVNFIHDEWQTECKEKYKYIVATLQKESLKWAGEHLKLNCPMDGNAQFGINWASTH